MDTTLDFILRLVVAALLGGCIGLEREYRAKEAGLRTHFLVAMGSALFMVLSQYGFDYALQRYASTASYDPSRIASQVVTGIGFIGAGTIIFQKHVVRGLTTAAGLWVTSAIGMTAGTGLYALAVASTLIVLICLEVLNLVMRRFDVRRLIITFQAKEPVDAISLLQRLDEDHVDLDSYEMHEKDSEDGKTYAVSVEVKLRRNEYQSKIVQLMKDFHGMSIENIE